MKQSDSRDILTVIVAIIALITAVIILFVKLLEKNIADIGFAFLLGFIAAFLLLKFLPLNARIDSQKFFEKNKRKIRDIWQSQKNLSGEIFESSKDFVDTNRWLEFTEKLQKIEQNSLIYYAHLEGWKLNHIYNLLQQGKIDQCDKEILEKNLK